MRIITLLGFILACSTYAYSQKQFELNQSKDVYHLNTVLEILEDKSTRLNFEQVQGQKFTAFGQFSQKISPQKVYWGRLTLKNNLPYDQRFVLYLGTASVCDVYIKIGDKLIKEKTGRLVPMRERKIKNGRNAPVPIILPGKNQNQAVTVYFRYQTLDNRKPIFKPTLYTLKAWNTTFTQRNSIQGIFNALLWTLIIYQFSLFILLKDHSYLFNTVYLFFLSLYFLSTSGILTDYVIKNIPKLNELIWHIAGISFAIFSIKLNQSFLETAQYYPRWHKFFNILFYIYAIIILIITVFVITTFNIGLSQLLMIFAMLPLVFIYPTFSIIALIKNRPGTLLYNLGYLFVVIFATINVFQILLNNTSNNSSSLLLVGFSVQSICFTIALAQKMKVSEKARLEAQAAQLKLIAEQKETLEQKVKERTLELEEKNSEVLTQNEELLQQQEEIEAQRDAIEKQNKTLTNQNTMIQHSIKAAQTIQQAILPYKKKLDRLLKDYFVIYQPRDVVSGDLYWLNEVDGNIFLAAIDCTGHGVPGAFMSLIGNTLLDKIIRVRKITNPAEILEQLHEEVYTTLRQEDTQNNYGMEMSLVVIKKEASNYKIQFCGAKNPMFFIKPASGNIDILKGDRKAIGGFQPDHILFQTQEITLPQNTTVYLCSDGFEDQSNPKRKRFGRKKLHSLMLEVVDLPMETQKQRIEEAFNEHKKDSIQRDDVLLLGFRLCS